MIQTFKQFLNESNTIDIKYWSDYNNDTTPQADPKQALKSKDFEETFEDAVSYWQSEADKENMINKNQIKHIRKLSSNFFNEAKWISVNVILAMIAQES